eukprot:17241-Heterococcus_DN1.PRE.3
MLRSHLEAQHSTLQHAMLHRPLHCLLMSCTHTLLLLLLSNFDYDSNRMQFGQTLGGRFGPDSFSTLQRCLKEEAKTLSLKAALAIVRLSHFDPDVFYKFKQVFIDKGPHATEKQQDDVRHDVAKVYECYFPLQPSKDVAFEIGRILMGLKDFAQAAELFKASHQYCGVHHVSWYNCGVCYYYLNNLPAAAECFDASLALCSDYPDAIKWRQKVQHLKEFLGDNDDSNATVTVDTTATDAAADSTSNSVSSTDTKAPASTNDFSSKATAASGSSIAGTGMTAGAVTAGSNDNSATDTNSSSVQAPQQHSDSTTAATTAVSAEQQHNNISSTPDVAAAEQHSSNATAEPTIVPTNVTAAVAAAATAAAADGVNGLGSNSSVTSATSNNSITSANSNSGKGASPGKTRKTMQIRPPSSTAETED